MNRKYRLWLMSLCVTLMMVFTAGCGDPTANDETTDNTSTIESGPVVGISYCADDPEDEDLQAYVHAVEGVGAQAEILPCFKDEDEVDEALENLDAVIITGGEDVNPELYGQKPNEKLEEVNDDRDTSDMLLVEECIDQNKPTLAICRGMQVLNVYCGGTLYQDLPTQFGKDIEHRSADQVEFAVHDIEIEEGSVLADIVGKLDPQVYSWHHQGIDRLGDDLTVMAKSDDGLVEAVKYDKASFVIAVQYHPEWEIEEEFDNDATSYFKALLDAAK